MVLVIHWCSYWQLMVGESYILPSLELYAAWSIFGKIFGTELKCFFGFIMSLCYKLPGQISRYGSSRDAWSRMMNFHFMKLTQNPNSKARLQHNVVFNASGLDKKQKPYQKTWKSSVYNGSKLATEKKRWWIAYMCSFSLLVIIRSMMHSHPSMPHPGRMTKYPTSYIFSCKLAWLMTCGTPDLLTENMAKSAHNKKLTTVTCQNKWRKFSRDSTKLQLRKARFPLIQWSNNVHDHGLQYYNLENLNISTYLTELLKS